MRLRSSKAACLVGSALVLFLMPVLPAVATTTYEKQESTSTGVMRASYTANVSEVISVGVGESNAFAKKALAITSPYLDVYESSDEASEIVGRLYENTEVETTEVGKEWTRIKSGNCSGYIRTEYLLFGEEASVIAENIGSDSLLTGYTIAEAEEKEAEEEAARIAEEERIKAEEEARRKAEEAEAARRQAEINNTISGTDFTYNPTMDATDEEIWLLAVLIDWEAGNQPYEGKLAVANVVLNRVRSSRYPNSIESVIYQRSQFSGVSNGSNGPSSTFSSRLARGPQTNECIVAALDALSGTNNIGEYMGFRALWSVDVTIYSDFAIIGDHVFH